MSSIQSTLNQINNNTAATNFQSGQNRVAGGSRELDSNAFLQLLMAQLRLQQQAAFTQIQKLDGLTSAVQQGNQLASASNLIGKHVLVSDANGNQSTITVDSVVLDSRNQVGIRSGESVYTTNQILEIYANTPGG